MPRCDRRERSLPGTFPAVTPAVRRIAVGVVACLVALVGAACGSTESSEPPEYTIHGAPHRPFRVGLPPDWTEIPLGREDVEKVEEVLTYDGVALPPDWTETLPGRARTAILEALIEGSNSDKPDTIKAQTRIRLRALSLVGTGQLLAIDPASSDKSSRGFSTLATIHRIETEAGSVQALEDEVRGDLSGDVGNFNPEEIVQDLQISRVTLRSGKAVLARYTARGWQHVRRYTIRSGPGEALVLLLVTDRPNAYDRTFDKIAQSLRPA